VTSDKRVGKTRQPGETTSDNTNRARSTSRPRPNAEPTDLPEHLAAVHTQYVQELAGAPVSAQTRRAYASRIRQYLLWIASADVDADPLSSAATRDSAVRDYRTHLQTVTRRSPATINTTLATLGDFYTRLGLGPPNARRLDLPQQAPRALCSRDGTRWLRAVQRRLNPRDRVLALLPFYAGLRISETVALNLDDIKLSARKGLIIVRAGKGQRYREVPAHNELRGELAIWINDERPSWPHTETTEALLLNHHGGRLGTRGAATILADIAADAGLHDDFTTHVLRHTFGTNLVRGGHDLVLVAELMGHTRLETTRGYARPTTADRENAINTLPTDR